MGPCRHLSNRRNAYMGNAHGLAVLAMGRLGQYPLLIVAHVCDRAPSHGRGDESPVAPLHRLEMSMQRKWVVSEQVLLFEVSKNAARDDHHDGGHDPK